MWFNQGRNLTGAMMGIAAVPPQFGYTPYKKLYMPGSHSGFALP